MPETLEVTTLRPAPGLTSADFVAANDDAGPEDAGPARGDVATGQA